MARELVHYLRMGTHAEKAYLERGRAFYDRIVLNANLVEASRGATSVFVAIGGKPYFIDPVTYAFALDPRFLLSSRTKGRPAGVKATFLGLSSRYELPEGFLGVRPLAPADLTGTVLAALTNNVLAYQSGVLESALAEDVAFITGGMAGLRPHFLIPPYFVNSAPDDWIDVNTEAIRLAAPVAESMLALFAYDSRRVTGQSLVSLGLRYADSDAMKLLIWPTNLDEHRSAGSVLGDYASVVRQLTRAGKRVTAAYGGFFGLLLAFAGMSGVVHGVGYGDKRDLEPVVGGGLPPATYYVRALRDAVPVGDLAFLVRGLSVDDFKRWVCDCVICSEILSAGGVERLVRDYSETEDRQSASGDMLAVPTARVYRATRFHYLANRAREFEWIGTAHSFEEVKRLLLEEERWAAGRLGIPATSHIRRWIDAIEPQL